MGAIGIDLTVWLLIDTVTIIVMVCRWYFKSRRSKGRPRKLRGQDSVPTGTFHWLPRHEVGGREQKNALE